VIAHPPCTRLCNSGVRWLAERDLWDEMREACQFFLECLNANSPLCAVENPVMHGHARKIVGRRPDFTVQPWHFGDPFRKRTCFWTRGLLPLVPLIGATAEGAVDAVAQEPPGEDRWKRRSITYPGIADAMVDQWASGRRVRVMHSLLGLTGGKR